MFPRQSDLCRKRSIRMMRRMRARISETALPRPENLLELVSARDFELVVAAFAWRLVRSPAQENRGVAKAVSLQMIVLDFADALDAQRLPGKILARAPAALSAGHTCRLVAGLRPFAPRMISQRVLAQRLELTGELL